MSFNADGETQIEVLIFNALLEMLKEMRQMRIMMEEITDARITTGEFEEQDQ